MPSVLSPSATDWDVQRGGGSELAHSRTVILDSRSCCQTRVVGGDLYNAARLNAKSLWWWQCSARYSFPLQPPHPPRNVGPRHSSPETTRRKTSLTNHLVSTTTSTTTTRLTSSRKTFRSDRWVLALSIAAYQTRSLAYLLPCMSGYMHMLFCCCCAFSPVRCCFSSSQAAARCFGLEYMCQGQKGK